MKSLLFSAVLILSANAWADKSILTCTHTLSKPETPTNSYSKKTELTEVFELDLEKKKIRLLKIGPKGKEKTISWLDKKGNPMSRDIHYIWKQIYVFYGDSTQIRQGKEITKFDTQRTHIMVLDLENNILIDYPLMQGLLDHEDLSLAFIDGIGVSKCTKIELKI